MSQDNLGRIVSNFFAVMALTALAATCYAESPGHANLVGVSDASGKFRPIARIIGDRSTITVAKINPGEEFDSLRIQFVFSGAAAGESLDGLFIKWEKKPGQWGQLWRINQHTGFDGKAKTFTAAWKNSVSFMLVDLKTGSRRFETTSWENSIRLWVDGKDMARPPSIAEPVVNERKPPQTSGSHVSAPAARVASDSDEELDAPSYSGAIAGRDLEEGDNSGKALQERIIAVERDLSAVQKWVYWGPATALVLSILFTIAALVMTIFRVSREEQPRAIPLSPQIRLRHSSGAGFSKAG
jgi:hypothetical protein